MVERTPQLKVPGAKAAAAKPIVPRAESSAPDWRPHTYVVKRGDTLFGIALDHGLDYKDIALWNGIDNPNAIQTGRELRLNPPQAAAPGAGDAAHDGAAVTAPLTTVPPVSARPVTPAAGGIVVKTEPKAQKLPYSEQALAQLQSRPADKARDGAVAAQPVKLDTRPETPAAPAAGADEDGIVWAWPALGKLVATFSESANSKGLDISGRAGQPVYAAAPGTVLYSGSGIRGYGKLIVLKHVKGYSSVYAHNSEVLVKEGQSVVKGQKIAEMGNSDTDQVKLHFEIRRLGKPIDPARYLPAS